MQTILYYKPTCPYCQRVLAFMQKEGITIPLKNTQEDPTAKSELLQIGGKTQVPCLMIEGRAMYESQDIITWLASTLKQ